MNRPSAVPLVSSRVRTPVGIFRAPVAITTITNMHRQHMHCCLHAHTLHTLQLPLPPHLVVPIALVALRVLELGPVSRHKQRQLLVCRRLMQQAALGSWAAAHSEAKMRMLLKKREPQHKTPQHSTAEQIHTSGRPSPATQAYPPTHPPTQVHAILPVPSRLAL